MGATGCEYEDEDRAVGNDVGTDEVEDQQADKGKRKSKGKAKAVGKENYVDDGKSTNKGNERLDAADKGKSKVDVAEEGNMEVPPFVDNDYDLSDKDEDNIMAAQVEGWKRVVDVMAMRPTDDTSDNDQLPSDSPSSGTEDEEENEHYDDTNRTRRLTHQICNIE